MSLPGGAPDVDEHFETWKECAVYWKAGYIHAHQDATEANLTCARVEQDTVEKLSVEHLTSQIAELRKRLDERTRESTTLKLRLYAADERVRRARSMVLRDVLQRLKDSLVDYVNEQPECADANVAGEIVGDTQ